MSKYNNQYVVDGEKRRKRWDDGFISIGRDNFFDMCKDMSERKNWICLIVWVYLCQVSYKKKNWMLSSKDIVNSTGISRDSYYRSLRWLKEKGYLEIDKKNFDLLYIRDYYKSEEEKEKVIKSNLEILEKEDSKDKVEKKETKKKIEKQIQVKSNLADRLSQFNHFQ